MNSNTNHQPQSARRTEERGVPTVSALLDEGALVELVYDPAERRTRFAVWKDGTWGFEERVLLPPRQRLVPYSAQNNLIAKEVVLFPSEPSEYGSGTARRSIRRVTQET